MNPYLKAYAQETIEAIKHRLWTIKTCLLCRNMLGCDFEPVTDEICHVRGD